MSNWRVDEFCKKPSLKNPIFIEGLPGIGNVGKVVVDFIVDELKAEKIYEITSNTFPHSVFVNEDNLVELPKIELFYKRINGTDLLLMGGDVQPIDEISSYDFSEKVLDLIEDFGAKEIITLGGIGLGEIPKKPKIYCTGNSKEMIKKYHEKRIQNKLYGVVGPIIGISGLLLGMAEKRNIKAISFLAETLGHPLYLGIKGAREIIKVLDKKLELKMDIKKLEKEIDEAESEMMKITKGLTDVSKNSALKKIKDKFDLSYIG